MPKSTSHHPSMYPAFRRAAPRSSSTDSTTAAQTAHIPAMKE